MSNEEIDALIEALKRVKREGVKRDKLSAKRSFQTIENTSDKQRGKTNADLNWQCMEVEKKKIDVARLFKDSCCDVSTEKRYFQPSGFHEYEY